MKNKVYLAGGMRSGWQEEVIQLLEGRFEFFNPRSHELDEVEEYKVWDLHYVKRCDILFGYMEVNNPSGYGLALEIGFAKALGKTIILIDERSPEDQAFQRDYRFIQMMADVCFNNLNNGISMLQSLTRGIQ